MTRGLQRALATLAVLTILARTSSARAHEGPPFPVVVDRHAGPYTISVWADPDVGTGTFFVTIEPPLAASDARNRVECEVQPLTHRLAPVQRRAVLQQDGAWRAEVPFDREERWSVEVRVASARGEAHTDFAVDVTPPGYGRWDLLIYFTPFALIGVLWIAVVRKKRALERAAARRTQGS